MIEAKMVVFIIIAILFYSISFFCVAVAFGWGALTVFRLSRDAILERQRRSIEARERIYGKRLVRDSRPLWTFGRFSQKRGSTDWAEELAARMALYPPCQYPYLWELKFREAPVFGETTPSPTAQSTSEQ